MLNDFIEKQSTMPGKSYKSKVLVGNWFEERCDKTNPHSYFYKEEKFTKNKYDNVSLTKEDFQTCSKDWLHFQNNNPKQAFETTTQREFKIPEEQQRNSVLKKFITRKDCFEKNPELLEEYRKRWTKSNQIFERTYLGANKK